MNKYQLPRRIEMTLEEFNSDPMIAAINNSLKMSKEDKIESNKVKDRYFKEIVDKGSSVRYGLNGL